MNPVKKFVYITAQLLCFFPLIYAAIRYRDVHDFDNYYKMLSRKLDWFVRTKKEASNSQDEEIK